MVTELTPVVLLLRGGLEPGDTLIIDEIEAHLHPAAQTQMATLLARLVRAGVRVLITTHSDWLLKELGNLRLPPGQASAAGIDAAAGACCLLVVDYVCHAPNIEPRSQPCRRPTCER